MNNRNLFYYARHGLNLIVISVLLYSCSGKKTETEDLSSVNNTADQRIEWWLDAKFGMFIHWGPYSVLGGEWNGEQLEEGQIAEWIMNWKQIPLEEYREVAARFNPTEFDAKEWVKLAKNSGMKYMIITAKHHDGFAMYDSKISSYNIVDYTPFGRDVIRELSTACAEAGIRFGIYYSHREDWNIHTPMAIPGISILLRQIWIPWITQNYSGAIWRRRPNHS